MEMLCLFDVGQVLVIGPDHKWVLSPLQPMPPFFKDHLNSKELLVSNIIISLCQSKPVSLSFGVSNSLRSVGSGGQPIVIYIDHNLLMFLNSLDHVPASSQS